jgi:hypothetical protein
MPRNICITAVDGHTGFAISELLLTNDNFKKKIGTVVGLSLRPNHAHCKELSQMGAKIIPHKPGKLREMVKNLKDTAADTLCLIPPAHKEKLDITAELIEAAKKAGIPNTCLISTAGCDVAEAEKQPHLRSFVQLEALFMSAKGDSSTSTGTSPVIIR